jgi:hypothetical protein
VTPAISDSGAVATARAIGTTTTDGSGEPDGEREQPLELERLIGERRAHRQHGRLCRRPPDAEPLGSRS